MKLAGQERENRNARENERENRNGDKLGVLGLQMKPFRPKARSIRSPTLPQEHLQYLFIFIHW